MAEQFDEYIIYLRSCKEIRVKMIKGCTDVIQNWLMNPTAMSTFDNDQGVYLAIDNKEVVAIYKLP